MNFAAARRRLRVICTAACLAAPVAALAAGPGVVPEEPAASVAEPAATACPPPVLPQRQSTPARDRGMLWRLQRDGRSSYLYGTLHVGRPEWQRPGPRVAAALAASQTLALEVDVDDPALMKQMSDAALAALNPAIAGSSGLPAAPLPLSPALQQRLAQAAQRNCLPLVALAGLPPLMQAASLGLIDARWLGLDPVYGQERALAAIARARGQRILSLETLAQQAAAMQPGEPQDTEAQLAAALQQLEDGSMRRVLGRLAEAWERGDLGFLERFEDWCECVPTESDRLQMMKVNDSRNANLAAGIVAEHGRGRRVFAAVGALHMTGPQALPRLLAAQGFQVRRVDLSARRPAPAPGLAR